MAESVYRTRSRRMKFCVHGGLGDTLNKQRRKPNGYPGALLADSLQKCIGKFLENQSSVTSDCDSVKKASACA